MSETLTMDEANRLLERGLATLARLVKGGVEPEEGAKLVLSQRGVLAHVDASTLAGSMLRDRAPEAGGGGGSEKLGDKLLRQNQERLAKRKSPLAPISETEG